MRPPDADPVLWRIAKAGIIVSWIGAAAMALWIAGASNLRLLYVTGPALIVAIIGSRLVPRATFSFLLFLTCLLPALVSIFLWPFYVQDYLIWFISLGGALIATMPWTHWQLFPRWRLPLLLWGGAIALTWPIVALREMDGLRGLAFFHTLHYTGPPLFHAGVMFWVPMVAAQTLLGVLWMDRLCAAAGSGSLRRDFLWPMAVGAAAAMPVAIYQGWFDLRFLGGFWPPLGRAAGTLFDANAAGVLCALWGIGWLVLTWAVPGRRRLAGAVIYLLSWAALWATGSRTALLAAAVSLPPLVWLLHKERRIPPTLIVGAVLLAAVALITLHLMAPTRSPWSRAASMLPAVSLAGARELLTALWERDGYGTIALKMVREYPVGGVGVSMFHSLVPSYSVEMGTPLVSDNAQNWYRHQLAETGLLGSVGWMLWLLIFALGALPPRRADQWLAAGALAGFGLISLVGMPGQNPVVAVTVLSFAVWFAQTAEPRQDAARARTTTVSLAAIGVLLAFSAVTAYTATHSLRIPFRAARFDFDYTYGFDFGSQVGSWTKKHAVMVPRAPTRWMALTYWIEHPDADERRVLVRMWCNGERIVNRRMSRGVPVTQYVSVPGHHRRFVLEVTVDRTFNDHGVERGVAMRWQFVDRAPQQN